MTKLLLKQRICILIWFVNDIVYNPNETVLLSEAIKAGATPVYGIKMLLYQGAESFEIWTGEKAPVDVMEKTLRKTLDL